MEERGTEFARAAPAHRGRGEREEVGLHSCIGQAATGMNKEMEIMGLARAEWEEGFLGRPLLFRKNVLS